MHSFALSLFGGFRLTLDGSPVTEFETSKVQALLAYLVVEAKRPHHRTALATLFWPDHPEIAARTNLRQVLHHLRQVLGDREMGDKEENRGRYLITTRHTIEFNAQNPFSLDVARFSALLGTTLPTPHLPPEAERIEQLGKAAELYRGDFLAGFYIQEGELFDEWVGLQREQYHRQVLDLFVYLATYYEATGNLTRAQHFATRQIELEPWREEAHRHLMLILARGNQRSAALAQYEQCRMQLAKELGVEPSAETTQLYEQIRAGLLPAERYEHRGQAKLNGQSAAALEVAPPQQSSPSLQDWGEAPLVAHFYGRAADQATLQRWLLEEQARLIMVAGMGGMGKTTLVAHSAKGVAEEFEFVFWRSLLNAPPLATFVREGLRFLARQQLSTLPESIHEQLNLLFDYLRDRRCLLVLDNLESILEGESATGYRPSYEGYGYLIERMGQSEHQSCLVLTSRELLHGMGRLQGNDRVNILQLGGLEEAAGQALLARGGLAGKAQAAATLVRRCSGNPLALRLVARTIQEFFDGDIAAFLSDELPIFDDIRVILDQHFARLTALEHELLIWMAIEREAVSLPQLAQDLVGAPSRREILEALWALQRRSLLEKTESGFILQNVVTEYITDFLIRQFCQELEQEGERGNGQGQLALFHRHALLKAQAMEYVRQSQVQLIVAPIAQRLLAALGQTGLQARLRALPDRMRANSVLAAGYAAGNLLNLLLHLGFDLQGYDFSRLVIRQANLRGANLPNVNFTGATFNNSLFTDTFNVVRAIACSPDGAYLAAGTSDGEIRLWRLQDGQLLAHNQGHSRPVNAVVFRPTGDLFASASNDFTVRLWDGVSGHPRQTLYGHTGWVNAIAFSANGKWLASASSDGTTRVWEVESGALRHSFAEAAGAVRAVAFHPHAPLLATSGGDLIRIWHLNSGQLVESLQGHSAAVMSLAYSPRGHTLASGSGDHNVRLWQTSNGTSLATLLGHEGEVRCLAFSPEGETLASGSADYTVRLWDVGAAETNNGAQSVIRYTLHGHIKGVNSLTFTPQGETLVSGGDDHTIHFWNPRNGSARDLWFGHTGWVRLALFNPQAPMVASCGDDTFVRLWDAQTGELRHLLSAHHHWVWSMAFSPDGSLLASGGADHLLCIWNAKTGELRFLLRHHQDTVRALAFSPDGALLASGSADRLVHLWEPASGKLLRTLRGHREWIQTVAFSPDGKMLATAGNDQRICLWRMGEEPQSDSPCLVLSGQQATIVRVLFSPDGSLLASAGDALAIYLWETDTGQIRHIFKGHENGVNGIAFSPDGRFLVSGASDCTVRLWDISSGEALYTLRGHTAWVRAVAFSPDGKIIASGSADHTICLWEVATGRLLHTLRGHHHWVWSLDFYPIQSSRPPLQTPTQLLASSSVDGTVRLWDVESGNCNAVLQSLGPYAGMKITGVMGISDAQKATLKQLGAVEF